MTTYSIRHADRVWCHPPLSPPPSEKFIKYQPPPDTAANNNRQNILASRRDDIAVHIRSTATPYCLRLYIFSLFVIHTCRSLPVRTTKSGRYRRNVLRREVFWPVTFLENDDKQQQHAAKGQLLFGPSSERGERKVH